MARNYGLMHTIILAYANMDRPPWSLMLPPGLLTYIKIDLWRLTYSYSYHMKAAGYYLRLQCICVIFSRFINRVTSIA